MRTALPRDCKKFSLHFSSVLSLPGSLQDLDILSMHSCVTVKHTYNLANGSHPKWDAIIPMSTSATVVMPTVTTKIVLLVFCADCWKRIKVKV